MKTKKHSFIFALIFCLYLILFALLIGMFVSFTPIDQKAPTEHVYTQTDRSFYFPGETIWFKSYVVVENHTISTVSDVLYAELITPRGDVAKATALQIKNGYAYGDFILDSKWVGGIYNLRKRAMVKVQK